jgi:hypothetical protein
MLCNDGGAHGIGRRPDAAEVQDGIEPEPVAAVSAAWA